MDITWADKLIDYIYINTSNDTGNDTDTYDFLLHYTVSPLKYIKKHGLVLGAAYFINTIDITDLSYIKLKFINKLFAIIETYVTAPNYFIKIYELAKQYLNNELVDKSILNSDHNERIHNIKNNIKKIIKRL